MDIVNPSPTASYGSYLIALRKARGFETAADFAKALYGDVGTPKLGSQLSNIYNWESDKYVPRGRILGKLAIALGVSPKSINPKHFKPAMMKRMLLALPPAEQQQTVEALAASVLHTDVVEPELLPQPGELYGDYIKRIRIARGYTTSVDFSKALNGAPSTARKIERGATRPMQTTVEAMVQLLHMPFALMDKDLYERIQQQGDEATETYGDYLGRLRRAAGYAKQSDFAAAWTKVHGGTLPSTLAMLNKWETGRGMPRNASQIKLAALFGISAKTLDPERFVPGRLLPPTLKQPEPKPVAPAPEPEPEPETVSADVQWDETSPTPEPEPSVVVEKFDGMPQFLKQHVDLFGISKTDDPDYVRIRFDAVLPRKTAGALMRELVILTTDDLLAGDPSK